MRAREFRLTPAIKQLEPGQSFITDKATARCAIAHFRHAKKKATQRTLADGRVQVWRLAE